MPHSKQDLTPWVTDPTWRPERDLERVWAGKDRHYQTRSPQPYDRPRALAQLRLDGGPASSSVMDRIIQKYGRHGRVIPGLIVWPINRFQQRPWLTAHPLETPAQIHDIGDETNAILEVLLDRAEEFQRHGEALQPGDVETQGEVTRLIKALRVLKRGGEAGLAAGLMFAIFTLLDVLSDGKLDGVIAWCRVLLPQHVHL